MVVAKCVPALRRVSRLRHGVTPSGTTCRLIRARYIVMTAVNYRVIHQRGTLFAHHYALPGSTRMPPATNIANNRIPPHLLSRRLMLVNKLLRSVNACHIFGRSNSSNRPLGFDGGHCVLRNLGNCRCLLSRNISRSVTRFYHGRANIKLAHRSIIHRRLPLPPTSCIPVGLRRRIIVCTSGFRDGSIPPGFLRIRTCATQTRQFNKRGGRQ